MINMAQREPLVPGCTYHIYNRGNNGETLFIEERNYRYFLKLYAKYIEPVAVTSAYCLMPNHFHFLVQIREQGKTAAVSKTAAVLELDSPYVIRQFNNCFIAYAKAINKAFGRTGALFEPRFRRKHVDNHRYFTHLVAYIHRNPLHHGFVDDFREWPWSSYDAVLAQERTRIPRQQILDWFGGRAKFLEAHQRDVDEMTIAPLIEDDWI